MSDFDVEVARAIEAWSTLAIQEAKLRKELDENKKAREALEESYPQIRHLKGMVRKRKDPPPAITTGDSEILPDSSAENSEVKEPPAKKKKSRDELKKILDKAEDIRKTKPKRNQPVQAGAGTLHPTSYTAPKSVQVPEKS